MQDVCNRGYRRKLRCANEDCEFLVHPSADFAGFCCRWCHKRYTVGYGARRRGKKAHGGLCQREEPKSIGLPRAEPVPPVDPLTELDMQQTHQTAPIYDGTAARCQSRSPSRYEAAASRDSSANRSRTRSNSFASESRCTLAIRSVPLNNLLFTQRRCSASFTDGKTLDNLIANLNNGSTSVNEDFLVLQVVKDAHGRTWCCNNRRLKCLKVHQEFLGRMLHVKVRIGGRSARESFFRHFDTTDGSMCEIRSKSAAKSLERCARGRSSSSPTQTRCRNQSRQSSQRRSAQSSRSHSRASCRKQHRQIPEEWEPDCEGRQARIEELRTLPASLEQRAAQLRERLIGSHLNKKSRGDCVGPLLQMD